MYEEKDRSINWSTLLKRLLWYILVIIVILGLIALITRCSKNSTKEKKSETPISLSNEVTQLQNATINYLSVDTLPQTENETRSIKLKYLIAKNAITPLKDSDGNLCDTNDSYVEITRLKDNYLLVSNVKCGKNTETKKVYIGCFSHCENGICIGEAKENGICSDKKEDATTTTTAKKTTTTKKTTKKSTSKTTNRTTSSTQTTLRTIRRSTSKTTRTTKIVKPTTTTKKPTTTTKSTTTTKKPTTTTKSTTTTKKPTTTTKKSTTTTKKPTTTTTTTTKKTTQPKKCYDHIRYVCEKGTLTNNNTCKYTNKKNTLKTFEKRETIYSGSYSTPAACLNAPSGYIYECSLDRVDWSSAKPFIYIKNTYSLCGSYPGYTYHSASNKCIKEITVNAKVEHKYSYNYNESGYINNGSVALSNCK